MMSIPSIDNADIGIDIDEKELSVDNAGVLVLGDEWW